MRLHVAGRRAKAEASLIVNWADGEDIADIEEAIKEAARAAVLAARERTGQHR